MDINEFINNLDNYTGPRSGFLFEELVLDLLTKHLNEQSKTFVSHYRFSHKGMTSEFDGFAPNGIEDLPGPTAVEIKFIRGSTTALLLNKIRNMYNYKFSSVNSAIIVINKEISESQKDYLLRYLDRDSSFIIKIWDLIKLKEIFAKYSNTTDDIIGYLAKNIINSTISNSTKRKPDELKEKRAEYLRQLKECYNNDGIVLFLGAGISKELGIPNWDELIFDLLVNLIDKELKLENDDIKLNDNEKKYIINELSSINKSSPLLLARYIRTGLGESFTQTLSSALYKNYDADNPKRSRLSESISKLCIPKRSGVGGVHAIITYNLENLIEEVFKSNGISYKPIYKDTDVSSPSELAVYHVHGFLPRITDGYEDLSKCLLVFSEEGYHLLSLDPYSWSNIAQLNFLREKTCLLIGLSITDPNLRRLLAIAARKSAIPQHFAVKPRKSFKKNLKPGSDVREKMLDIFANVNQGLQDKSLQELGLNTIWIDDYDEIPDLLDSIRG
jgi:hypothetical protein